MQDVLGFLCLFVIREIAVFCYYSLDASNVTHMPFLVNLLCASLILQNKKSPWLCFQLSDKAIYWALVL